MQMLHATERRKSSGSLDWSKRNYPSLAKEDIIRINSKQKKYKFITTMVIGLLENPKYVARAAVTNPEIWIHCRISFRKISTPACWG